MTNPTLPHGTSECRHQHGDFVVGMWVCGQCYTKLDARPRRLGKESVPVKGRHPTQETRQTIVWQAEVRKSAEGTTLAVFLKAMVRRFRWRSRGLGMAEAYGFAIDALKAYGGEFGDPDWDWSRASARDMADEEMAYWESGGGEGNG